MKNIIAGHFAVGDRINFKLNGGDWMDTHIESIDEDSFTVVSQSDPIDYDDLSEVDY